MPHNVIMTRHVPTSQRVAFITIDDGYNMPDDAATYVSTQKIPVTLFLSVNAPAVFEHPEYFKRFLLSGQVPQSHGAPHDDLRGKSYGVQYTELTHAHSEIRRIYGAGDPAHPQSPTLFRPPYGQYDFNTLAAVDEIGYAWLVMWSHYVEGAELRNSWHQPVSPATLDNGDIVLCHFNDDLAQQLHIAVDAITASGLRPAYLVDYLT